MSHLHHLWLIVVMLSFAIGVGAQQAIDAPPTGFTIHVVQRGENLFRIALNYGLTTDELATLNSINNVSNIQVGQRLLIPLGASIEEQRTHTLQIGETLLQIADLYAVPYDNLLALNGLTESSVLYAGQMLQIPEVAESDISPVTEPNNIATGANPLIHVVTPNETLFRISQQYGVDVNNIAQANSIADPTLIYVGQMLVIPGIEAPQIVAELPEPLARITVNPQVLVEGRTGVIKLESYQAISITGEFLGRSLIFSSNDAQLEHRVFVGVPMFINPGIYPLQLIVTPTNNTASFTLEGNIQVFGGGYGREVIRLMDGLDDLLNNNIEQAEAALLDRVTQTFTPTSYLNGAMSLPAAAAITSGFGTRRSYNNGADFDRYHSGTDFAGVPGTPILAPAAGRVILADRLNVRGNATVIDHGLGIYTGYWHQSEIYVQLGEQVSRGQIIGTIGATGRVTGAHLHWELWVNGVPVDPMQWVQQTFIP